MAAGSEGHLSLEGQALSGATSVVSRNALPCLLALLPGGEVVSISPSLLELMGKDLEAVLDRPMWDNVREGPSGLRELLAAGVVDGAEFQRTLVRADGTDVPVHISIARISLEGGSVACLVVVAPARGETEHGARPVAGIEFKPLTIGTVDDQWRVDRISSDVGVLLGRPPAVTIGRSAISFVHPDDVPSSLIAIAHAMERSSGTRVTIRLLDSESRWVPCELQISPLVRRPAFGFVVSPMSTAGPPGAQSGTEQALWNLAFGSQAVAASRDLAALPDQYALPALGGLSTRELQIVIRLAQGRRVPAIATDLFLTQGTVRNHLSNVFAKLGVHSQQELIDVLHARPS